jgi:hypothetical protein
MSLSQPIRIVLEKKHPEWPGKLTFPAASGWIAGERLMGVTLVIWANGPELCAGS